MGEFDLIKRYFADLSKQRDDVVLGIGDDCALLKPSAGKVLAVSTDTLVSGRHFLPDTDPVALGHKALAVNLSDLAAMGAEPAWVSLALTVPKIDHDWLAGFCQGFAALADQYQIQLIGGDTTRGALSMTVQVYGWVEADKALQRSGAKAGDHIFVTGTLGDAAAGLSLLSDANEYLLQRLHRPSPRVVQGLDLAGRASAAIDISDGLLQDLQHILTRSGVGADLYLAQLPLSADLQSWPEKVRPEKVRPEKVRPEKALNWALAGGDDYELCFCIPPDQLPALQTFIHCWDCACTEIGRITTQQELRCMDADGCMVQPPVAGFDHFKEMEC